MTRRTLVLLLALAVLALVLVPGLAETCQTIALHVVAFLAQHVNVTIAPGA